MSSVPSAWKQSQQWLLHEVLLLHVHKVLWHADRYSQFARLMQVDCSKTWLCLLCSCMQVKPAHAHELPLLSLKSPWCSPACSLLQSTQNLNSCQVHMVWFECTWSWEVEDEKCAWVNDPLVVEGMTLSDVTGSGCVMLSQCDWQLMSLGFEKLGGFQQSKQKEMLEGIPLSRFGSKWDIAMACIYLSSRWCYAYCIWI